MGGNQQTYLFLGINKNTHGKTTQTQKKAYKLSTDSVPGVNQAQDLFLSGKDC